MFSTSEEKLQDQLTRTMSVVFEGVGELGGQVAEDRRLTYAWHLRHVLKYNSEIHEQRADILRIFIIFFTLAAVTASVLFSYYDSTTYTEANDVHQQLDILTKLTLILPLIITVLRGINAALSPDDKSMMLRVASIRVESEIYMYRTRTGSYSIRKNNQNNAADAKKVKGKSKDKDKGKDEVNMTTRNPRKAFSNALDSVLTDLSASDVNRSGLINPDSNSDPLKDINDRIKEQASAQDYYLLALTNSHKKINNKKGSLTDAFPNMDNFATESPLHRKVSFTKETLDPTSPGADARLSNGSKASLKNYTTLSGGGRFDKYKSVNMNDNSDTNRNNNDPNRNERTNSMFSGFRSPINSPRSGDDNSADTAMLIRKNEEGAMIDIENNTTRTVLNPMYDDGLSVLTADEYVRIRLIPYLSTYAQISPSYSRSLTIITCIVILLSIISSIFSGFHLTTFIPLALALGEALHSWESHKSIEIKLMKTNGARDQLNKVCTM